MKSNRKQRGLALLLSLLMILSLAGGKTVTAAGTESNLKLLTTPLQTVEMTADGTMHMQVIVQAKDGICVGPRFDIYPETGAPFEILNVEAKNGDYEGNSSIIMDKSNRIILEYDIKVSEYATIGHYSYYITYTDPKSNDMSGSYDQPEPGLLEMKVAVVSEKMPPQLSIVSGIEYEAEAGDIITLKFKVKNEGELQAYGASISVGFTDDVLIPQYTPLVQRLGNLMPGATKEVSISYKVLEDAPTQRVKLPVTMNYKNAQGTSYSSSEQVLYLTVEGKNTAVPTPGPSESPSVLLLNTVTQMPESPKAGELMTVGFYLENKGSLPITEIKIAATGLSSTGFEPISSEPYQYIDRIAGGAKQKVELQVRVGKLITEGLNTLNVQYSYVDGNGIERTEHVSLYILNVQSAKEEQTIISRPKLMVSNFYTDIPEVKAGSIFDFTFEILNTNDTVAAQNIKVTVSGSSGTFSVTSGGNSFFVPEIEPGKTAPITINLKASAAAMTGAYPINIKIEYEYEGMQASGFDGEVVQEEILLQVKENLRPSVENVYVGWGSVTINQPAAMNFEFYNMGKSTLNNTYITIEGDFMLANGSNSYYIGNIQAGMPEYVEFDVIPLVEGEAVGKMIIHMEDSNGDEVTMEKEFTSYVEGEFYWDDPGFINPGYPGYDDPGMWEDPSMQTGTEPAEEPIVSVWIFAGIQAAVLILGITVTRAICLARYRKRIKEEDAIL